MTVCAACASGAAYAADTPWVEESISTHKTGSWSRMVLYNRTTGLAPFNGKEVVYTPNTPSTGDYVTVNVRMSFSELANGDPSDDDIQAAIHITSNNVFQVWTKPGWLDVAAQGITPVSNVEYAVQFIMDYKAGVYSVAVQDDRGEWRRLRSASGGQTFPLAVKANAVKAVSFEGRAQFRSLKGSYTPEKPQKQVFELAGSRRGQKTSFLSPPGAGGVCGEFFESAGSRRSQKTSFLSPPGAGDVCGEFFESAGSRRGQKTSFLSPLGAGGVCDRVFSCQQQAKESKNGNKTDNT